MIDRTWSPSCGQLTERLIDLPFSSQSTTGREYSATIPCLFKDRSVMLRQCVCLKWLRSNQDLRSAFDNRAISTHPNCTPLVSRTWFSSMMSVFLIHHEMIHMFFCSPVKLDCARYTVLEMWMGKWNLPTWFLFKLLEFLENYKYFLEVYWKVKAGIRKT